MFEQLKKRYAEIADRSILSLFDTAERAKDYRQQALTLAGQVQAEQSDYQPIADVRLHPPYFLTTCDLLLIKKQPNILC